MKTAKEMFVELGFILKYDYENLMGWTDKDRDIFLNFDKERKEVEIYDGINNTPLLRSADIKAIYKQMEELGWLEK